MDPLTIGLITGGANLLGSFFSNSTSASNTQAQIEAQQQQLNQTENFNAAEAQKAMDFSAQQAEINRNYQTTMSNTAYQRAAADMKAAGLNPILAAGGSGASTPGGAMASGVSASVGTPGVPVSQARGALSGIGDAVNRAVSSAIEARTFDRMTQEVANLKSQQALTAAQTETERVRPEQVKASIGLTTAQEAKTQAEKTNVDISRQIVGNEATRALHERELREKFPWLDQAGLSGRTASDVVAPIVSSALGAKRFMPDRWFW